MKGEAKRRIRRMLPKSGHGQADLGKDHDTYLLFDSDEAKRRFRGERDENGKDHRKHRRGTVT